MSASWRSALAEIIRRHEALRTNITQADGKPVQVIHDDIRGYLSVVDLPGLTVPRREEEILQRSRQDARRPFDLARDRLLRIEMLRFETQYHVMLINMHHIVSDGWSLGVIVKEMVALYGAGARRSKSVGGIADPVRGLRSMATAMVGRPATGIANRILAQAIVRSTALLALPTDRPRPSLQTYRGSTGISESIASG